MSVFTSVPSTRNSTRCTLTLSVAVAARFTLVVPAGNAWLGVGAVKFTTGAVLPPVVWMLNAPDTAVLNTGEPASYAVADQVWLPAARPVAVNA